ADPHAERFERKPRARVPLSLSSKQVAHVVRDTGQAEQTGTVIQPVLERLPAVSLAGEMEDHTRIEVAAADAHHEPFERRAPHARTDGAPVVQRGRGAALPEWERIRARARVLSVEHFREVLMRVVVEAVSPYS